MSKNKAYKTLKYSIRQCNEEEIEIRNAFFDGYPRGFIRLLFIGVFYMSWYQNAKYKEPPFSYEIAAIKEDFVWTFNSDEIIKPLYNNYLNKVTKPDFLRDFPNTKIDTYQEYKNYYVERHKWNRIRFFSTQFGWHSCYFYSVYRAPVESGSTVKNGLFMHRF